jgi:ABC-2 type transport system permease protein
VVATVLVLAGPEHQPWFGYGVLCDVLGIACLGRAGRDPLARAAVGLHRVGVGYRQRRSARRAAAVALRSVQPRRRGHGPTPARVLLSECTKFWSLRSGRISVAVAVGAIVGLAPVVASTRGRPTGWSAGAPFDPGVDLLVGVQLAPFVVGVLGVLVVTAEYATDLIRYSLTVVPARMPILWAKLAVVAGVGALTALVAIPAALLAGVAQLRTEGWTLDLADRGMWTTAVAAAVYLVLVGVIGMALGALLRSTPAATTALVGMFFGAPIVVQLLPGAAARWFGPYLPSQAGQALWAHPLGWHITSRPTALIVLAAWAGALFAAASFRLLREDA